MLGTIQKLEQLRNMPMPIDSFVLVRSVGTFARALDCSSSVKQPSLHMSAAAASRDITQVLTVVDTSRNIGGQNFQHVCLRCLFKICESFKYNAWYIKFIV